MAGMPVQKLQKWKDATIEVVALVSHAGRVPLKQVACPFIDHHCEAGEYSPRNRAFSAPARSTMDMLFVMRRPHEFERQSKISLDTCFIDSQIAYD